MKKKTAGDRAVSAAANLNSLSLKSNLKLLLFLIFTWTTRKQIYKKRSIPIDEWVIICDADLFKSQQFLQIAIFQAAID